MSCHSCMSLAHFPALILRHCIHPAYAMITKILILFFILLLLILFYRINTVTMHNVFSNNSVHKQANFLAHVIVTCQIRRKPRSERVSCQIMKGSVVWFRQQKYLVVLDRNVDDFGERRMETHKLTGTRIHHKNPAFKVTENQLLVENKQL